MAKQRLISQTKKKMLIKKDNEHLCDKLSRKSMIDQQMLCRGLVIFFSINLIFVPICYAVELITSTGPLCFIVLSARRRFL